MLKTVIQGDKFMKDETRGKILQITTAIILVAAATALVIGAVKLRKWAIKSTYEEFKEKDDSYTLVIDQMEWGPGITSILINAGRNVESFTEKDLDPSEFDVKLTTIKSLDSTLSDNTKDLNLKVAEVHFCDIDGNILDSNEGSGHLLLDLDCDKYDQDTCLFLEGSDGKLYWKGIYKISVEHKKLNTNIINENSPIISKDAKHQIIDMDIKFEDSPERS